MARQLCLQNQKNLIKTFSDHNAIPFSKQRTIVEKAESLKDLQTSLKNKKNKRLAREIKSIKPEQLQDYIDIWFQLQSAHGSAGIMTRSLDTPFLYILLHVWDNLGKEIIDTLIKIQTAYFEISSRQWWEINS